MADWWRQRMTRAASSFGSKHISIRERRLQSPSGPRSLQWSKEHGRRLGAPRNDKAPFRRGRSERIRHPADPRIFDVCARMHWRWGAACALVRVVSRPAGVRICLTRSAGPSPLSQGHRGVASRNNRTLAGQGRSDSSGPKQLSRSGATGAVTVSNRLRSEVSQQP